MKAFYLGIEVEKGPVIDGWCWCIWPDKRRFKHWAAQVKETPWGEAPA